MIIDFHSHILPGIDDGSADVQESIAMLRMEAEQGITHVIATPHFYTHSDSPGHFLAKRKKAEMLLPEYASKMVVYHNCFNIARICALADAYEAPYSDEEFNIVRSKRFFIKPMSVEEAILQMNLLDHEFFVFRNMDEDEAVSVVYKRKQGGYGLILDSADED